MLLSRKAVEQHAHGELTNPVHIGTVETVRVGNAVAEVDDQIMSIVRHSSRDSRSSIDYYIFAGSSSI